MTTTTLTYADQEWHLTPNQLEAAVRAVSKDEALQLRLMTIAAAEAINDLEDGSPASMDCLDRSDQDAIMAALDWAEQADEAAARAEGVLQ